MNPKIAKVDAEYEKNKEKIAQINARQRELENQRQELVNGDILGLVHSYKLSTEELAALLAGTTGARKSRSHDTNGKEAIAE